MEDMNILAFFLSYPSLPIDASDEASEEALREEMNFAPIFGVKRVSMYF